MRRRIRPEQAVKNGAPIALILAMGLLLGGCGSHQPTAAAPIPVLALPIHGEPGLAADMLRFPAQVAARYQSPLSFRVSGKLAERMVALGAAVHRGQVLARLDDADARQQLASAQALLATATHRLEFARQQLERDKAQSAQNLIAAAQLEQTEDAFSAAQNARDEASAQLVLAQNQLRYQQLIADHEGWISDEQAETGQVVAAGQPVFMLAWSGETDIHIDVAEDRIDLVRPGQHAAVTFAALPGQAVDAAVREVAPAADPQSRTFRVKLALQPPPAGLRLGMTGEAVLDHAGVDKATPAEPDFRLPATALFHKGEDPAVWVVRPQDSTLELRPVRAVRYVSDGAVVSGGLREGEQVVLAGVHTVYAGEIVRAVAPLFSSSDRAR